MSFDKKEKLYVEKLHFWSDHWRWKHRAFPFLHFRFKFLFLGTHRLKLFLFIVILSPFVAIKLARRKKLGNPSTAKETFMFPFWRPFCFSSLPFTRPTPRTRHWLKGRGRAAETGTASNKSPWVTMVVVIVTVVVIVIIIVPANKQPPP